MATTIDIVCPQCSKQFKAPAALEGKRVRCKACGHGFVVQAAPAPARPKPAADDEDDGEAGPYQVHAVELKPRCPHCAAEMSSAEAVICVNCGYNKQTRARMERKRTVDVTSSDRFKWLLPGFACVVFIVVLLVLDLLYYLWTPDENSDLGWLGYGGFKTWGIIASIFFMVVAGQFAFRRLVLHPEPPEKERK